MTGMDTLGARLFLDELRALPAETEWLDFKEARRQFDTDELGKYVSALSNEANLRGLPRSWLVLGVADARDPGTGLRPLVGTAWRLGTEALNELKHQIARDSAPAMTALELVEVDDATCAAGSRVLMISIPPAPRGMPIAWKGHYYGRAGSSLVALGSRYEVIRMQAASLDWSAVPVTEGLEWADTEALAHGRRLYASKHPIRAAVLTEWSDTRFLGELGLMPQGRVTRAAVLLFGRRDSAALLGDVSPRISWTLMDASDVERDYAHFRLPLILAVDAVASRIRVHTVRILPPGQLAPLELPSYDDWVFREALLNCIAHQDYTLGGRVMVTERPDRLWFANLGAFIPGTLERVLANRDSVHQYRNTCLAEAMVDLGLIDTIGSGIRRMFRTQRERLFPLPDFELGSSPPSVKVCLYGRELDTGFSRALLSVMDLTLDDVIALDRVQKQRPLDSDRLKALRTKGLIEGRGRALRISGPVARAAGQEVRYTLARGLDAQHYKALVVQLLSLGPQARRRIDELLLGKLPGSVPADKQKTYIKNLLRDMADRDRTIEAFGGNTRAARWRIKRQD
jgi:ATP-dependent DNA helicase RecG